MSHSPSNISTPEAEGGGFTPIGDGGVSFAQTSQTSGSSTTHAGPSAAPPPVTPISVSAAAPLPPAAAGPSLSSQPVGNSSSADADFFKIIVIPLEGENPIETLTRESALELCRAGNVAQGILLYNTLSSARAAAARDAAS